MRQRDDQPGTIESALAYAARGWPVHPLRDNVKPPRPRQVAEAGQQSIEAEQSVLGGMLLNNAAIVKIPSLKAADFYDGDHRVIFERMRAMISAGKPADVITVYEALQGNLGRKDLLPYLTGLVQNTPSAANISAYSEIIVNRSRDREVITRLDEARDLIASGKAGAKQVVEQLVEGLRSLTPSATPRRPPLHAEPFMYCQPSSVPPRAQLFRAHYIRRFVGASVAPGGVGKSMLAKVDLCSMVIGRDLLGRDKVVGSSLRVWYMGLEDDMDEHNRGFMAICKRYELSAHDLEGLFVTSGRDRPFVVATETRDGVMVDVVDVEALKDELRARRIDVLVVDPFVESHGVSESVNDAIKQVMGVWRQIANDCNVAIDLIHHIRKNGGVETSIDDVRGASAMKDSARTVRLLSTMSEKDARAFGLPVTERRRYVSVASGKANFSAPSEAREWFMLETVSLDNGTADYPDGDHVGVPVPWSLPGPLALIQVNDCVAIRALAAAQVDPAATARVAKTAGGWFGKLVASYLNVDLSDPQGAKDVERILAGLMKNRWLKEGMADDTKRMPRPIFLPGPTGGEE